MAFSPPVVGCLVKKGLEKGGHGHPRTPLATPMVDKTQKSLEDWKYSCGIFLDFLRHLILSCGLWSLFVYMCVCRPKLVLIYMYRTGYLSQALSFFFHEMWSCIIYRDRVTAKHYVTSNIIAYFTHSNNLRIEGDLGYDTVLSIASFLRTWLRGKFHPGFWKKSS